MATNTIPSDAASIFDALSASQKNALAYPSPSPGGIAGLIFDWVGEERLELRSDITDSWLEDNTAVNDQIALYPERFTVDASTAEVVFAPNNTSTNPSQPLNPLSLVASLIPSLTPGAAASLASTAINGLVPGVAASSVSGITSSLANTAAQVITQTVQQGGSFSSIPSTLGPALINSLGSSLTDLAANALGLSANSTQTAVSQTPSGLYGYYQGVTGQTSGQSATVSPGTPTIATLATAAIAGAVSAVVPGSLSGVVPILSQLLSPTAQTQPPPPANRQVSVMGFIYQLWKGRQLFTVETPWGIFTSMAIELADGVQPAESRGQTDHKITFKKVRISQDPVTTSGAQLGRSSNQSAEGNPSLNGNIGQVEVAAQQAAQYLQGWGAGLALSLL